MSWPWLLGNMYSYLPSCRYLLTESSTAEGTLASEVQVNLLLSRSVSDPKCHKYVTHTSPVTQIKSTKKTNYLKNYNI